MEPALELAVELPLEIAENLKQALTSAFYESQARDLIDGYRQLTPNPKWSPMTRQLQSQIEILQSWIDVAKAEAAEEEVSDDEDGDAE
jgi:hypothetical protein